MSRATAELSMIMAVKEDCGKIGGPQECAGCGKKIHDKYLLKVQSFVINISLLLAAVALILYLEFSAMLN